ncbi:MAG TPA: methyl-accepting chemotaxis protein, partial [Burkholderiales bacterium]|nr:methyl-accepting chemotaxis protein [Burkholderiales bacterium]
GILAPEIAATDEVNASMLREIESLRLSEESRAAFLQAAAARNGFLAARDEAIALKRDRSPEAGRYFDTKFYPALAAYDLAVQSFVDGVATDYIRKHSVAMQRSDRALLWLAGCVAAFFVSAFVLVWLMVRSITRPVHEAVRVAEALAKGDLTRQVEAAGGDEIAALMHSLASASRQLAHLVRGIQDAAAAITGGAQEISHGNTQLSQRTESQASSLEETASSLEELTATVTHNADNANQANRLVQQASAVARKGGEVVGEVVRTMQDISTSSQKIAEITGIIDGIAFQTNILALNAAVEAARAGDQGRGFAVVAAEVRSLAQRSAEAAKEIKALIDESVGKVESGSRLAAQAGSTMEAVVESVRKVADITGEITQASREQASGIQQVNQAMTQMDQVTQQNAALVEQVSAASVALQEQALALMQAVAVFRTQAEAALADPVASAGEEAQPASDALPAQSAPALPEGPLALAAR